VKSESPKRHLSWIMAYIKTFGSDWMRIDEETGGAGRLGTPVGATRNCDAVDFEDEKKELSRIRSVGRSRRK
jgi:hypothetical protein